ncbi:MAG: acyl-CoA dehydrogenase family protein [Deltaproteobacteria bacterium]|nr:acyl-CoA dehydrogenase family protein [Deltaproteobacteria bacterium]
MRQSHRDLGFFFEDRHNQLAERLPAVAEALTGQGDAGAIAASLGAEHDLYRLLADETGVDLRAVCLVREVLGYVSPLADSIFAVHGLGTHPIVLAGSEAQKVDYLDRCRAGASVGAFALTEPEAGSDVASMQTVADKDGDGFRLRGTKTFISNAGIASHYVVFANADPEGGRDGISAFLVPHDADGLRIEEFELGFEHPIGTLHFDGCAVPKSAVLGELGTGFKLAMRTLDAFRVSVGAAAVGMAGRALDEAANHVRNRQQFGKPLSYQPIVQSHLADMATELDAARLLVFRAAHAKDTLERRVSTEAAMAKLYATEAAQRIIDTAVQLHGGLGVKTGVVVEELYRAIRPLRIYEGTSEIQRLIIGRAVAKGEGR